MTNELLSGIVSLLETNHITIQELDAQLNPVSVGRKTVIDSLINEAGDTATNFVDDTKLMLAVIPNRLGVIAALQRALKSVFAELNEYVEANIPEIVEDSLTEERMLVLREQRKAAVDLFNNAYHLASSIAPGATELAKYAPIKHLRGRIGGTGAKGPRLKGSFVFSVDGVPVDGHRLTDVAKAAEVTVTELRDAISQHVPDFDYKMPPSQFAFVVNNKNVVATESITDAEPDDDDDDVAEDDDFDLSSLED